MRSALYVKNSLAKETENIDTRILGKIVWCAERKRFNVGRKVR